MGASGGDNDLLHGVPAIAEYLELSYGKAYGIITKSDAPIFRIAGKICARKSGLKVWLAECEAKAREARAQS
jgi:hypothetical protein